MRTIAYVRVSTEDQAINGVSLSAQEEKIKQYCNLYSMELIEVISDAGFSAKNLNRAGVKKIIALMEKKGIDAIVVAKLDRLTRSIRDLAFLVELANQKGIALVSVNEHIDTSTAAGRMILNMLGVISQWEREVIGERTSNALQFKKRTGKVFNKDPLYGYYNNGEYLSLDNEEQLVISLVMKKNKEGESLNSIAKLLNNDGYPNRTGGRKWFPMQVKRIIKNFSDRQLIDASPKTSLMV